MTSKMHMGIRTNLLFLIFFICSLIFSGCIADSGSSDKSTKFSTDSILKVGVSTNSPPLIFKKDGKITGLEATLARKFAAFSGKQLQFVEVPWNKQIEYLNQGKTDIIMSGMTITIARNYLVTFSRPYLLSGQIMLVRLKDRSRFSSGIVSLMNTNYRIGTVAETTGDLFVTSTINGADKTLFKTSSAAVKALIKEDIDVLVYDAPMVCHYAAVYQSDQVVPVLKMATQENIGWAMRKTDTDLKVQADSFIQAITSSGELKNEINNWIPYLNR